ncbi:hypothetical protein CYMTET_26755 [Cymbomonas tetramitiformis]|uniref:Uncharacterized protein n=1 Tax=Cymbomonas tetramitiformis TaxID=36881 RepID=A0AAE0KXM0_9CHLO|nr:hypothetical protein CYMTET_26755 [Cymbomonas tetramitiformis]|eukprot:gene29579-36858_t
MSAVQTTSPGTQTFSVAESGKAQLDCSSLGLNQGLQFDGAGDYSIASQFKPNIVVSRLMKAPAAFVLKEFGQGGIGATTAVLAAGDPSTKLADTVALGMVRKNGDQVIDTITALEWTPKKTSVT